MSSVDVDTRKEAVLIVAEKAKMIQNWFLQIDFQQLSKWQFETNEEVIGKNVEDGFFDRVPQL